MRVVQDNDNVDEWVVFRFDDDETVAKNGRKPKWVAIGVPQPQRQHEWLPIGEFKRRQREWIPIGSEVENEEVEKNETNKEAKADETRK